MTQFAGVDIARVTEELRQFVEETTPQNGSRSGSNHAAITNRDFPRCGRAQAIALTERVRPILDRLYPEWEAENPSDKNFEFAPQRDAAMRLLERIASRAHIEDMLGPGSEAPALLADRFHPLVWQAASAQWSTGHRHEAVLAAAKAVNSQLQSKLGRRDASDTKLVRDAFSERPASDAKPRLRFASIEDEQTRESMREGAMNFGAGCFMAIRNPVGHLPNDEHELSEQGALEQLAAFSVFARFIDQTVAERGP